MSPFFHQLFWAGSGPLSLARGLLFLLHGCDWVSSNQEKTFEVSALGCRTNQYEAQAFKDQLIALGYRPAEKGEKAAICIVNSCTVTEQADRSSRQEVRRLAKEHEGAQLLVTGCSAESHKEQFLQVAGVSAVVPNREKEQLLQRLFPEQELPEFAIRHFEAHTRAFVKVQDGCNSFCSYCVIPYVRGRSRSRRLEEIVAECRELIAGGFKEIVLTGINIGDFDGGLAPEEGRVSLAQLVRAVDQLEGLERLRLSSIDPDEVDEELLEAIVTGRRCCPSMHIVLQSGSNVVLKRMRRKYTRQVFLETIERLLSANPRFTFTTDLIVGFPGETEEDHAETLQVIEQVRFAKVHVFPFSLRPGTRAVRMEGHVDKATIAERKQQLLRQSEQAASRLRQEYLATKSWVLTEGEGSESSSKRMGGHTDNFLQVWIEAGNEPLAANQLVEVELIANEPEGLIGHLVGRMPR